MNDADDVRRAALEDQVHFERLVCDLAARFVNLAPDRVDDEIREAQREIVEALDLDRSTLYQLSDANGGFAFTHYWSRPELPPPPPDIAVVEAFPWALGKSCEAS